MQVCDSRVETPYATTARRARIKFSLFTQYNDDNIN